MKRYSRFTSIIDEINGPPSLVRFVAHGRRAHSQAIEFLHQGMFVVADFQLFQRTLTNSTVDDSERSDEGI